MIVFHRTSHGDQVIAEGFSDAAATYLTRRELTGVWVSTAPIYAHEGAIGDALIAVDVPDDFPQRFVDYEWVEAFQPYREWLIPAAELNQFPRRLIDEGLGRAEGGAQPAHPTERAPH